MRLGLGLAITNILRSGGSAPAWTPASLFAASEVGAWYDPSDLTAGNMYQDSAKTTAVTAVEQPVGWIQDKSGNGNHASQSTAANRPVLRSRYNRLTYSEQFDNAAWANISSTDSANAAADPLGGSTADSLLETATTAIHGISHGSLTMVAGATYSAYVYVKGNGRGYCLIYTNNASGGQGKYFSIPSDGTGAVLGNYNANTCSGSIQYIGSGWYRCTLIFTASLSNSTSTIEIYASTNGTSISYAGDITKGLYLWGAQVNRGSTALPYQRIAAATDYVTSSTMEDYDFPYYLDFDGVDDVLTCGNPDLSTDATVAFAIPITGDSIAENQTIGANYSLNTDCCALVLLDRNLAGSESTDLAAYLDAAAGVTL